MHQLLELIATNQLLVIALSGVVWAIGKWDVIANRPALVHGLWLLILLKCFVPPLVNLQLLPSVPQPSIAGQMINPTIVQDDQSARNSPMLASHLSNRIVDSAELATSTNARGKSSSDFRAVQNPVRLKHGQHIAILTASLLGSVFIFCRAARRIRSVGRLLKQSVASPEREARILENVCQRVGVKNVPGLMVLDADISPMLWAGLSSSTIVLPERLLRRIDDQRLLHILMHEMAHYVRRDHISNTIAFLAVSLFWWNPVLWLVRRQLHLSAEASSDAFALEQVAGSRKHYAETLMMVIDDMTACNSGFSTAAISFGESHSFRWRIKMIATSNVKAGLSRISLLILICAAAISLFMPVRAQEPKAEDTSQTSVPDTQSSTPIVAETPQALTPPKADVDRSSPDQEVEFTTSAFGPVNKNAKFKLPDYIPAAHGNVVEIVPKHYFMLTPVGSTHKWHVRYIPTNMDEILTIPPLKDLRQGQTFPLQKRAKTTIIAFVESDYSNDLDIGVKIIDNATGEVRHQCTLLMNVSRYQWVGDWIEEK